MAYIVVKGKIHFLSIAFNNSKLKRSAGEPEYEIFSGHYKAWIKMKNDIEAWGECIYNTI
jgi:hypothetical protein